MTTRRRTLARVAVILPALVVIGHLINSDAPHPAATDYPTTIPSLAASDTVARVIDGDTVEMASGARVRIIGIDTPERGQCGYQEATDHLIRAIEGKPVILTSGARDDIDRYGRELRYVDLGDTDIGLALIRAGLAVARYDSRDGYGAHNREAAYIQADADSPAQCDAVSTTAAITEAPTTTPAPLDPPTLSVNNCAEARAAGAAPVHRGEPGYSGSLDRDGDGVGCE